MGVSALPGVGPAIQGPASRRHPAGGAGPSDRGPGPLPRDPGHQGQRTADGLVEGGYPRSAPDEATPTAARPLLLVRDDPLPTWVILGAIDATRVDWLRALAAGKPAAERSPDDWRARVALVVPHLNDPEPLAAEFASAELGAAPYAALRTAKPLLDAAALRRCLADPALAARHPFCLLLLGICGSAQDAATLEARLQAAWQSGAAANPTRC